MLNVGIMGGIYRISEWIMRLAYLNILWIFFTIMGLGVFGFVPATVAIFSVMRKWFIGDTEIPIFKTLFNVFKEDFINANIFGFILAAITYILYLDFNLINTFNGTFQKIMYIVLIMCSLLLFITMVYSLPVYVHYRLKLIAYFKHSLVIGIISPLSTIMMGLGLFVLYHLFIYIPGLIPLFGVSLICMVVAWPANISFKRIEQRKRKWEEAKQGITN